MKIVLIGAGSARFAQQLVGDFCLMPTFKGADIVLVDADPARLELVTNFAHRYANEMGGHVRFTSTMDRGAALDRADFVVNTALAGGRGTMEKDRKLWEQYGYYRGINVDVPHRQLVLMVQIAREMDELCPEAWLLQCGNPVTEGCTLMQRATGFERIIGICHGYQGFKRLVALIGLDPGLAECTAAGINHNVWATRFTHDGHDIYPCIDRWMEKAEEAHFSYWTGRNDDYMISRVVFDLYRQYGILPIGDTARAINHMTWWYHLNDKAKEWWYGPTGGWDSDLGGSCNAKWLAQLLQQMRQATEDHTQPLTGVFPPQLSEWQVAPILDSIASNRPTRQQVNVVNGSTMPQLPADLFVEFPGLVNRDGVHAVEQYTYPALLMHGILGPRATRAELIIQAFLTGDPRFLLESMLIDHKTVSRDQAVNALIAHITAEWNKDMAEHYGPKLDTVCKLQAQC